MVQLNLPDLQRTVPLTEEKTSYPTLAFHRWWQEVTRKLAEAFQGLTAAVNAVQLAQKAADTAQAAAVVAQNAADGANSVASLTSSGVTGLTLSAVDAGSSATISVSAHTRVYGNGSSVSVSASPPLTGLSYSTLYYVFYDQPSRSGGTVSYQITTSQTTAAQTGNRHLVGAVTTPAAAGPAETGDPVNPPGLGNIQFR